MGAQQQKTKRVGEPAATSVAAVNTNQDLLKVICQEMTVYKFEHGDSYGRYICMVAHKALFESWRSMICTYDCLCVGHIGEPRIDRHAIWGTNVWPNEPLWGKYG